MSAACLQSSYVRYIRNRGPYRRDILFRTPVRISRRQSASDRLERAALFGYLRGGKYGTRLFQQYGRILVAGREVSYEQLSGFGVAGRTCGLSRRRVPTFLGYGTFAVGVCRLVIEQVDTVYRPGNPCRIVGVRTVGIRSRQVRQVGQLAVFYPRTVVECYRLAPLGRPRSVLSTDRSVRS